MKLSRQAQHEINRSLAKETEGIKKQYINLAKSIKNVHGLNRDIEKGPFRKEPSHLSSIETHVVSHRRRVPSISR